MQQQPVNQILENEVTIKDIFDVVIDSWISIVVLTIVGIIISVGYLRVTPSQYEATAHIKLAQIYSANNTNPLGVNLEDPNSLILRLKIPSAYSSKEVKECGLLGVKSPEELLASLVRASAAKGSNAIIELKIRLASKKQSVDCAQSVYQWIRESQFQVMRPYIEDAKISLLKHQAQLQENKDIIPSADKSGSALSAVYLANREEINFLKGQIFHLNSIINSGDKFSAKLVAPIYASDTPVSPDRKRILQIGLLAGMLSGLVFAFIRKFWLLAK